MPKWDEIQEWSEDQDEDWVTEFLIRTGDGTAITMIAGLTLVLVVFVVLAYLAGIL